MYDFLKITEINKNNKLTVRPDFKVRSDKRKDLMIKGGDFYAVWDENKKLWSTDESVVIRNVDAAIDEHIQNLDAKYYSSVTALYMDNSSSGVIDVWHKYVKQQCRDNYHTLDNKVIFANQDTVREDYATKKLPYNFDENGSCPAYEELMSTLYSPEERDKLEWAVGAIINGDSKKLQKFIVLYGEAGSGKSTFLSIVEKLFDGYYCMFEAKALTMQNNQFSLEPFKDNPLVAIQHDGDLSKIEDNTKLNSLVSHEKMVINQKHKNLFEIKP